MDTVLIVWAIAVLAIFASGIHDLVRIVTSVAWLKRKEEPERACQVEEPFIIVLLPVLREQKLITDTLRVFTTLKYSLSHLRIFVITTEKELAQREEARVKLIALANDIASKRFPAALLLEKYLGVFSENVLEKTIEVAQGMENELEARQYLFEIFDTYPTTIDLVKAEVARLNQHMGMPLFAHLHYPGIHGDVNQQLEYAVQQLPSHLVLSDISKAHAYLAIYNADSKPHTDTFQLVRRICSSYYNQHTAYPPAIQQSSVFLENIAQLGSKWAGVLLQAGAVLQTRWVLSHEIPRLHRQSRSALQVTAGKLNLLQRLSGAEFALCVGHGFFLRYDLAENLGLFSASNICDDFLWSFRLCIEHVPILPMPLLESAESPTTMKSLILQRRSWFLGYTEYPKSMLTALHEGKFNRLAVAFVTGHGLIRAFKWLMLSPVVFLAFILPIFARSWQMFFITCGVYAIYGFLTYGMILTQLEALRSRSGGDWSPLSLSRWRRIGLVMCSLPTFLVESLGLWWCLFQRLDWAFARKPAYRQKTER